MSTSEDRERMEREDLQPGMSTFDRAWDAANGWRGYSTLREKLMHRATAIEAGDRVTAQLLRAAADQLGAERAALAEAIVAHMPGCARDQNTTQYCAEAVRLEQELREARQEIYRLQTNAACCRTSPLATTRDGEEPHIPEAL